LNDLEYQSIVTIPLASVQIVEAQDRDGIFFGRSPKFLLPLTRARALDSMDEAVWKAFQHGDFDDMLDKLAVTTMNFRHFTTIVSTEISGVY
jgi:hypothetical protein